ncbi:MAG: tandem-95 repeat protein [Pirellulales bacterium]|nr:tandem-95 repeat protein [Pirellulales bacterium]
MKRLSGMLCVIMVLACAPPASAQVYYGDFDWRQNGGNYVTPIRNQGGCGSCWAFGATAGLESQFLINDNTPGVNLDLSEQHLLCDGSCGDCDGGYENQALEFFVSDGITDEATLPYRAQDTSPLWPLTAPYTLYKTTSVDTYCTGYLFTTTKEIKSWLEDTGPLPCAINTADWYTPGTAGAEADGPTFDFSTPEGYETGGVLDPRDPVGDINHAVCIVGYKDDPSMSEKGYWIVKNSWGAGWGDAGYGFFKYGDIEKHSRVHAIIGDTYTTLIEPANYAPVAVNDPKAEAIDDYTADEDSVIHTYAYNGVLANDTDADGDDLTAHLISAPAHGTVALDSSGWFTYTPDDNFYGTDSFTYQAYDGEFYSNSATVNLDIVSVNDAPIAVEDSYSVDEDDVLHTYAYNGVLSNDTDADNTDPDTAHNDTLTAELESGPAHGQLTFGSSGWFTYTPNAGFDGTDSFTYTVFDGTVYSDLGTVIIEVLAALEIPGDATGDGVVNKADSLRLAANWGQTDADWSMGDFDDDGIVGPKDAAILAANWGYSSSQATAVPEPSTLGLLLMGVVGLLAAGRRARHQTAG